MDTKSPPATGAALLNCPGAQHAFTTAKRSIAVYGALTALGLVTVVVAASSGHLVNTFMSVREVLLPAVAVLLYRMTVSASRGSRRALERVRTLAILMPLAIVGIDLIPGVCPPWFAVMQAVCMLPIVPVAFITRRSALGTAFDKGDHTDTEQDCSSP
jgi:cytochrome bd-type quinol oxidase subunit 2